MYQLEILKPNLKVNLSITYDFKYVLFIIELFQKLSDRLKSLNIFLWFIAVLILNLPAIP